MRGFGTALAGRLRCSNDYRIDVYPYSQQFWTFALTDAAFCISFIFKRQEQPYLNRIPKGRGKDCMCLPGNRPLKSRRLRKDFGEHLMPAMQSGNGGFQTSALALFLCASPKRAWGRLPNKFRPGPPSPGSLGARHRNCAEGLVEIPKWSKDGWL